MANRLGKGGGGVKGGGVKQSSNKSLAKVIEEEENFNFRLYVFPPPGIHMFQMLRRSSRK